MKLSIFGTGYVGLVSGACLAEVGHDVVCMDVDPVKIANLKAGILPIWEPGLAALVERNAKEGRLRFTTDAAHAVQHAQVQFIAVGTPPDEDGSADMQYVLAVAQSIASHMTGYKVIVNKSTVPVGTADQVAAAINAVIASPPHRHCERSAAIHPSTSRHCDCRVATLLAMTASWPSMTSVAQPPDWLSSGGSQLNGVTIKSC